MKQIELRQLDSLAGAQTFLDAHANQFGNINASDVRTRLDDITKTVQDRITVQLARTRASHGETKARTGLEQDLRKGHMNPIAEFARAKMTGLDELEFRALTPSAADLKGARLVQAARGMAKAAEAHLPNLEAGHFPADVVTQLVTAADAVQANLDRRKSVNIETVGATADIRTALAEGRAIVRTIGAVVKRAAHKNPGLLAEWRSAQRVKIKPGVVAREVAVVGSITPATPQVQEVKTAAA